MLEVEQSNLLVENLGKNIYTNRLLARSTEFNVLLAELLIFGLEQGNLSKHLVREGAGHDKGGVASGTAKVDQAALSQKDDVTTVGHQVAVNLGLDVLNGLGVGLEPSNVNFNVEVADVLELISYMNLSKTKSKDLLQTMASFRMASKCLPTRISRQPVVVTKIWPREAASSMVVT